MIEKKQPVTKQFLLSFKSGHGDFYQKFINILHGRVHYCRRVKDHESCPPHMMAEKCIFMAILERKHEKFKNQEFQLSQLMTVFEKYRPQILKSIATQKNCILKKMKSFKIEEMENSIVQIVTRQNFGWNSFDLPENTYIYELFKAILSRSQQVSIFGQHKYQPMTYSYIQVKQISSLFNESIVYFDYNSSKSAATNLKFSHQTTYILKVKERYTILYVKQPKEISIQSSGTISLAEVEAIFIKELPKKKQQEKGFFDKLLGSKLTEASQLRESSKLFPDQIQCAKCSKKFSEFDCLKWNYEFFCQQCLQNPKLDTSSIPSTLIQKYFMERNIKHDDYKIQCPQCTGFTYIRKYNPSKKPHKIRCEVCEHNICLQHNQSINQCFCQCLQCRNAPTINVLHLNIAVCESCRKKFCRVCQKLSVDFCQCICKVCFERKDDDHICKERCHYCRNHVNNMKVCGCGGKMCYGCYYYNLKEFGKMDKFQCAKKNSYFK